MLHKRTSLFLRLTVPQEEDEVLGHADIRLIIQGSEKSLLRFVVPVAGMELFLYWKEDIMTVVFTTSCLLITLTST